MATSLNARQSGCTSAVLLEAVGGGLESIHHLLDSALCRKVTEESDESARAELEAAFIVLEIIDLVSSCKRPM